MAKINPATAGQKIVVIVGPTASGKSDLALRLAKKFNGEIISADSRQVYRGMDIGTGKVERDSIKYKVVSTKDKKEGSEYYSKSIRHHLIDVANPKKQFTAVDFKRLGQKAIAGITSRGKIPIIAGGTGFYIDVLLGRMQTAEVSPNLKLRKRFNKFTAEHLFEMLQKLDPERAKTIEPKNKRRLIRAIEIAVAVKKNKLKTVLPMQYDRSVLATHDILWIGLKSKNLETRIKKRLDARLKQEMVREVINLHKQGISWKRLDNLGLEYRWVSRWLQSQKLNIKNQNDRSKIKNFEKSFHYEKLLREIIKYSKRQMTWFKRNPEIKWVNSPSGGQRKAENFIKKFLS